MQKGDEFEKRSLLDLMRNSIQLSSHIYENYVTKTLNAKFNEQFLRAALTCKIIRNFENENPKNISNYSRY
jgi:alcohol dehydrogenase YqhD (iron-dependent ADH family)